MDNRKEVKRENKQVRKLKKLKKLNFKGKTDTSRYKKLKQQVYNPFIDDRKDMKNMGAAMSKIKNPIPKYDPPKQGTYGVPKYDPPMQGKYGVDKSALKRGLLDYPLPKFEKNPSPTTGGQGIKMTAAPHEYLFGGGMVKGSFNLAKSLAGKAISKAKPILKNLATDFGIDQAL
jgi:hypothetical protein